MPSSTDTCINTTPVTTTCTQGLTTDIITNQNMVHITTSTTQDQIGSVKIRIDGRKSVPSAVGSPLYGRPSWWGEQQSENTLSCVSDSELSPRRRGTQILRDIDHKSEDESDRTVQRPTYKKYLTPVSQNRSRSLTTISKQSEHQKETEHSSELESTSTSFTVEFEAPKKRKPKNLQGPRPLSYGGKTSTVKEMKNTPQSSSKTSSKYKKTNDKCSPLQSKPPSGSKPKSKDISKTAAQTTKLVLLILLFKIKHVTLEMKHILLMKM